MITSEVLEDVLIGCELLLQQGLSNEELKYMLPSQLVEDKDRNIQLYCSIKGDILIPVNDEISLYLNEGWILVINADGNTIMDYT